MKFTYTGNAISIKGKVLTDLDDFVFDFLHVLDKYCTYVIISGYLPIFFGRSRGTEVVDVFIDHIDEQTFIRFYNELVKENYYFLNPEGEHGLYKMLTENLGIRAADKESIIPNIEMKFTKDDIDRFTMKIGWKFMLQTLIGFLLLHLRLKYRINYILEVKKTLKMRYISGRFFKNI